MAYELHGEKLGTQVAAANLTTHQYKIVKIDTNAKIALAVDGDPAIGVLQNKPNSDQAAEVAVSGVTKVIAGAAVAKGDLVASDANGKLKTAATGDYIIGLALEAASADGNIITIYLKTYGIAP